MKKRYADGGSRPMPAQANRPATPPGLANRPTMPPGLADRPAMPAAPAAAPAVPPAPMGGPATPAVPAVPAVRPPMGGPATPATPAVPAVRMNKGGSCKAKKYAGGRTVQGSTPPRRWSPLKAKREREDAYWANKPSDNPPQTKKYAKGGDVEGAKMEKRHANFMKKKGAPKKMVNEEMAEAKKYAKGGGIELRGKTRGRFV